MYIRSSFVHLCACQQFSVRRKFNICLVIEYWKYNLFVSSSFIVTLCLETLQARTNVYQIYIRFHYSVRGWLSNAICTLVSILLAEFIFYLFEVNLYFILLLAKNILYTCALRTGHAGRVDERIYRCRSIIILYVQQLLCGVPSMGYAFLRPA